MPASHITFLLSMLVFLVFVSDALPSSGVEVPQLVSSKTSSSWPSLEHTPWWKSEQANPDGEDFGRFRSTPVVIPVQNTP